jgi:hypothetical protein
MDRRDGGQHERPGGKAPARHLDVAGELAGHVDYHRPDPQRLLDHGIEVLVVVEGVRHALHHPRRAQEALEGPRQPGGGGLVAGGEQGEQLVAQLDVAHGRAVVVAGGQQQREHVVALVGVLRGAPVRDLGVDQLIDRGERPAKARRRREPTEVALHEGQPVEHVVELAERGDAAAKEIHAPAVADSENGAQDRLQGDRLHPRPQRERGAERPVDVAPHRLPVEGRQQQLALGHVALLVEREQRVLTQGVAEHGGVGLAGVKHGRIAGEHFLPRAGSAT